MPEIKESNVAIARYLRKSRKWTTRVRPCVTVSVLAPREEHLGVYLEVKIDGHSSQPVPIRRDDVLEIATNLLLAQRQLDDWKDE